MRIFPSRKKENKTISTQIFLHTTNAQEKVLFEPIKPGKVSLYSCGPTVYDFPHIGNYRPYVFSDVLTRLLMYVGYDVTHAINITDVGHLTDDGDMGNDKMEEKAKTRGISVPEIALEVEKKFMEELNTLSIRTEGVLFPKATEHIREQIAFIETLEQKGYTYKTSDGVYFDTSKFPNYGKLGNRNIEEQKDGARVAINPEKHNQADFALWKFSKENENRQQEWESPWGVGYPGWHIECSAMAIRHLGKTIDIHTGGVDHVSTHHNNEIAQSESATNKQFVRNWLHVEHITVEGSKISKSIGNTIYIRNLSDRGISPISFRYWLLTGHYRTHMNFTWEAVMGAHTALFKLHKFFTEHCVKKTNTPPSDKYVSLLLNALCDDVNTPQAIAHVWELVKDSEVTNEEKRATLLIADQLLGLDLEGRDKLLSENTNKKILITSLPNEIQTLIQQRDTARAKQDWAQSDAIRDTLIQKGYRVIDTKDGTTVEYSKQTSLPETNHRD